MCPPCQTTGGGGGSRTIFASLYLPRYSSFFAAATFAFPNEEEHFAFSLSPFCFRRICPTFCVCPPLLPPPRQLKSTKKSIGDLSFFSLFFSGKWRKTGEKMCHQKQLGTRSQSRHRCFRAKVERIVSKKKTKTITEGSVLHVELRSNFAVYLPIQYWHCATSKVPIRVYAQSNTLSPRKEKLLERNSREHLPFASPPPPPPVFPGKKNSGQLCLRYRTLGLSKRRRSVGRVTTFLLYPRELLE